MLEQLFDFSKAALISHRCLVRVDPSSGIKKTILLGKGYFHLGGFNIHAGPHTICYPFFGERQKQFIDIIRKFLIVVVGMGIKEFHYLTLLPGSALSGAKTTTASSPTSAANSIP